MIACMKITFNYIDKTDNRIYLYDYLDCEDPRNARIVVNKMHAAIMGTQSIGIIYVQSNVNTGLPFGGQGLKNKPRLIISLSPAQRTGVWGKMTLESVRLKRTSTGNHTQGSERFYNFRPCGGFFIPYAGDPDWFEPESHMKVRQGEGG